MSYIDINLYELDDETLKEIKNILDKQDEGKKYNYTNT